jgi:hypothetical protein
VTCRRSPPCSRPTWSGRIGRLDVLMRPVNTVIALRAAISPRMMAYLKAQNG